jgi:hypothetical protein
MEMRMMVRSIPLRAVVLCLLLASLALRFLAAETAAQGPSAVGLVKTAYSIADAATHYRDVRVSLLDPLAAQTDGQPQSPAANQPQIPGLSGMTYTDPVYGYALTWDPSWSVLDFFTRNGSDVLRITNGPITADIYGYSTSSDSAACLNELMAAYQSDARYSSAAYAVNAQGEPLLSAGTTSAIAVLELTFLDEQGVLQTINDYALCLALPGNQAQVRMEQYIAPEALASLMETMNALQNAIDVDGAGSPAGSAEPGPAPISGEPADPGSATSPDPTGGHTFVSPTFGYSITWDDPWVAAPADATQPDQLALTADRMTAVLVAVPGMPTATESIESLLDGYRRDPAFRNAGYVTDDVGAPVMTPDKHVASALLRYEHTSDGSTFAAFYEYSMCALTLDGRTAVCLEQIVAPGDFVFSKPGMEALQSGLRVTPTKSVSPPGLPPLGLDAMIVGEEPLAEFQQLMARADGLAPNTGRSQVDLPLSGEPTWSAGISARDIRVHAELSPGDLAVTWELEILFRAAGFGTDSVSLSSAGSVETIGIRGQAESVPTTIDLIAIDGRGYLAFDGGLVALIDLSTWRQPGDVVLSAYSAEAGGSASLQMGNVWIWNLNPQPAASLSQDGQQFQQFLAAASTSQPILFGPSSGTLLSRSDLIQAAPANVSVSDFGASVSCIAPVAMGRWDCGFIIGGTDEESNLRVWVTSYGTWNVSSGNAAPHLTGPVELPPHPPGTPVLVQFFAIGGMGYLGVAGEHVATFDLSLLPGPGSVWAATGFSPETVIEGVVIAFEDFTVWSFDQ